jgi:hypothetical protein
VRAESAWASGTALTSGATITWALAGARAANSSRGRLHHCGVAQHIEDRDFDARRHLKERQVALKIANLHAIDATVVAHRTFPPPAFPAVQRHAAWRLRPTPFQK